MIKRAMEIYQIGDYRTDKGANKPLKGIIERLEDPKVRLEDNSEYRLNLQDLGNLYAYIISQASIDISPGKLTYKQGGLQRDVLKEFQKRFQQETRGFLYSLLGNIELRTINAEGVRSQIKGVKFNPIVFADNSVERRVSEMFNKGRSEEVGQALKDGSLHYQQETEDLGRRNHQISLEYVTILNALNERSHR